MHKPGQRPYFSFVWLAFGGFALGACGGGGSGTPSVLPSGPPPTSKLLLRAFEGPQACSALERYLGESFTEQYLASFRCFGIGPCAQPFANEVAAPGAPAADGGGRTPDRVSETNTQEAGVDEADLVKADSQGRLYLAGGDELRILRAFPPESLPDQPLVRLALSEGVEGRFTGQELLLDEARGQLVVLGQRLLADRSLAESVLVDVRDPSAPQVVGRLAVEGVAMEARRVGQRVHRFSRFDPRFPNAAFEDSELQALREAYFDAITNGDQARADARKADVLQRLTEAVRQQGAAHFLPQRQDNGVATALGCSDVVVPELASQVGLAVFQSFDLDGANHAVSAALNSAYLLYASTDNLYLAQNSVGWFFSADQPDETVIHRFELSATDAPRYRGLGRVPGSPPHRFALSEFDGHLRIATTAFQFSNSGLQFSNHLQVLRIGPATLTVVGRVDDYAPGETTRGVRFLGARGFVVTFEQIDPLFAFDLSDPTRPTILSELKIPGFSSYLQPLGEDFLLTIGRGGDDEQLDGKVSVQLFDVRDLANVKHFPAFSPEAGDSSYSYSTAEYDARAFTYFPDLADQAVPGTLAVPLRVFDGGQDFAGFMVIRVDPASAQPLRELSRVDHAVLQADQACEEPGASPSGGTQPPCGAAFIDPLRTIFMQDAAGTYLFTLSTHGVVAVDAVATEQILGVRALTPVANDCHFCADSVSSSP